MHTQDIEYRDGDVLCRGYVAYQEGGARRPGVLVVPEAFGLDEHALGRARQLAELGYVGFAVDMYGGRRTTNNLPEAMELMGPLRSDPAKLRQRAGAALATMSAMAQVDAAKLGGIGFCFGGTTVIELARDGRALAGVASFHGGLETTAPAQPGKVKASILVLTGAEDPLIPPAQVMAFEDEMRNAKADWQVVSYGNAVHSFTNPAADGSMMPGIKYDAAADKRSWAAMRAFFDEVFGRA